ncbi:MAG: hypothetical protein LAN64_12210 [Acidobacteriia bacterium]|nr:hypothetical protein [Terriglobia bacterium]
MKKLSVYLGELGASAVNDDRRLKTLALVLCLKPEACYAAIRFDCSLV